MDQIYIALAETFIPWVEDRFGTVAAWIAAGAFIVLPLAGLTAIVLWLLNR